MPFFSFSLSRSDPAYSPGRSVAILALGKLIVPPRRHGGRPPLLWPLSASPLFTDCALVTAKARITDPAVRAATASVSTSGEDNKDSSVSVPSSSSSSSTMSAKIAAPHVARFLLVLRLALTTGENGCAFACICVYTCERIGSVLTSVCGRVFQLRHLPFTFLFPIFPLVNFTRLISLSICILLTHTHFYLFLLLFSHLIFLFQFSLSSVLSRGSAALIRSARRASNRRPRLRRSRCQEFGAGGTCDPRNGVCMDFSLILIFFLFSLCVCASIYVHTNLRLHAFVRCFCFICDRKLSSILTVLFHRWWQRCEEPVLFWALI